MKDPILEALARDVNDLRERLDILDGKKTLSPSYKELLDRNSNSYSYIRDVFRKVCKCSDALRIEDMCRYIIEEYEHADRERTQFKQEKEHLEGVIGNALA
jgi:cell shape-determining protein MreC